MLERLSLDGKVVVITGGGTGLGWPWYGPWPGPGRTWSSPGRRLGPIEDAAAEVKGLGREALALSTDVSDSGQVDHLIQATLERFGQIDVLINNAALVSENVRKPIWEITDGEWQGAMDVNLNGAFNCARAAAKPMADRGQGKIVNVASGFGLRGAGTFICTVAARGRSSN